MYIWFLAPIFAFFLVFVLFLTALYASDKFSKLWFAWIYTRLYTPTIRKGTNAIRAKLFKQLQFMRPEDSSQQLVN
jgi:hypothetical protein